MPYCGNRCCSGDCDCCESRSDHHFAKYEEQEREEREWQERINRERAIQEHLSSLFIHTNFQRLMNELLKRGCRNCWFTNVSMSINVGNFCEVHRSNLGSNLCVYYCNECCNEHCYCKFPLPPPLPPSLPLQRHETYSCAVCPSSSGCTTRMGKCWHP
jgi:hypothetical protein